jgi:AcrR family transcriptional regulator
MPRQRFLNLPIDARSRLLDLAMKEFAERGFDDASLNEILSRAGISKGAYYYYFDDKEDLFATAVEGALDRMLARMPLPPFDDLTREEFWPAVERSVGQWALMYDSSKDLLKATLYVTEARRRSPRFAAILAKAHVLWRTLIEGGQRLGCVRTDIPNDHLIRLVEANDLVLDTIFLQEHAKLSRAAFQKHIRLVLDTFKRLLVVEPPSSWSQPVVRKRKRRG